MNLNEYENFVHGMMSESSKKDFASIAGTAGLGLAGEAGEVADIIKKLLFHGQPLTEEIKLKIKKELGDCMFYMAWAATQVAGCSLQEVIDENVRKLQDRYKTGTFTVQEFLTKEAKKND